MSKITAGLFALVLSLPLASVAAVETAAIETAAVEKKLEVKTGEVQKESPTSEALLTAEEEAFLNASEQEGDTDDAAEESFVSEGQKPPPEKQKSM